MTKRHFIALADAIREHNKHSNDKGYGVVPTNRFGNDQVEILADFCQQQNGNFNRQRWLDYVAGRCGPNGGAK